MISSEEPRARLSIVSQISVAGALIACHLFIFQIIVHFSKQKKFLLYIKAALIDGLVPFTHFLSEAAHYTRYFCQ